MPLQRQQPLEVPLGGSPDQSTGELFRGAGVLANVTNGDHAKRGELRKRRGYRLLDLGADTHGATPEVLFVTLGIHAGELVVYGRDFVYGVHADTAIVDGASVTRRGPAMLGDVDRVDIHATGISD